MRDSRILIALLFFCFAPTWGIGAPYARFWLSDTASGSAGPKDLSLGATVGETVTLYVWGRPSEDRQFSAVSLDLVASTNGVDFLDGTYTFHNEINGSTDRFEFVTDSTTTPSLASEYTAFELSLGGVTDALRGLNGFTQSGSGVRGPGPTCSDGELNCEIATDDEAAWLIATVQVEALSAGEVDFHLQIGDRGVVEREMPVGDYDMGGDVANADHTVWADDYGSTRLAADGNRDGLINAADYTTWRDHWGDSSTLLELADTEVRFGIDGMGGDEPAHNALTDQQTNLAGDDPDAALTIITPRALSVPEPATAVVTTTGLLGLISNRRRHPTGPARFF